MGIRQWLSKPDAAEVPQLLPRSDLEAQIIAMLRCIFDPEIPVNIYDLGLIYDLKVDTASGTVHIRMTLTAPACPVAQSFPETVANMVRMVPGVEDVKVEMVWDPPWSKKMMSEAARLELGML